MKDINSIMLFLSKEIGFSKPEILHSNAFKTLISTVLSARTKDKITVSASRRLFKKFSNAKKLSKAPVKQVEKLIFPVGFYKTKAKRVIQISKIIINKFDSKVPKTLEELTSLPGVGRKTANIVLAFSFKIPAIAVDVHVHRISNRLGIVKTKTPEETEQALMKILPKKFWLEVNELMVRFGQRKCFPRKPNCLECSLQKHCDYFSYNFLA